VGAEQAPSYTTRATSAASTVMRCMDYDLVALDSSSGRVDRPIFSARPHMTSSIIDFDLPSVGGATCLAQARANIPEPVSPAQRDALMREIAAKLKAQDAAFVAHYYVDGDLQDLALATGGCVADSLEMARFGRDHPARTLIVAGVRFMGETAKILSPEKRVLMPDLEATCSLAAVKARADWMVTSACALPIVAHLKAAGQKVLWAPDRHLGRYIQQQTGADMLLWDGACIVHDEFKAVELELLREQHPDAQVLVHPESPEGVVALADVVGSTTRLLNAVVNGSANEYIVATDGGILHRMRQLAPGKTLIEAPTAGNSATCKSCAHCPWMAMNGLRGVLACLDRGTGEISVPEPTRSQALLCIERMLDFVEAQPGAGAAPVHGFVPNIGAA
jgi:quinolinate synthase